MSTFMLACNGSSNETLYYKNEEYEGFRYVPLAFNKDTILPQLWIRTLNVDGDNKRLICYYSNNDTTTFTLPNAVNNYTNITCYSLQMNDKRYLWIEDNFGTTVFDIDLRKVIKVKEPAKDLNDIAATGALMGVKKDINLSDFRLQLNVSSKKKILLLDSLSFRM